MRFFRPPAFAPLIYRDALFRFETGGKELCLTFDDGPDDSSTPGILNTLRAYQVRAAFFCSGFLAEAKPRLMDRIRSDGHTAGNHGYNHLNGFRTPLSEYIADILRASEFTTPYLFRPPFGKITIAQYRALRKSCRIVLWDLMPYDFDVSFGSDRSLKVLRSGIRKGSIIVFHNKPGSLVNDILEPFIEYALGEGYRFVLPREFNP